MSPEIAAARGVAVGQDCVSPSRHAEFSDADSLLDWVELLAAETGLPVGIKSAVGDLEFWETLADLMGRTGRGVDFINIDGGEGGTGAAPLLFTDSVALPFRLGFSRVYSVFAERGLHHDVVFIGAGKLGLPDNAVVAFALGCDLINVGREAMLAVGCIQSQKCHTDRCPTGVATQNRWLTRGLDPTLKSVRAANYIKTLRRDLLKVSEACGVEHPALIDVDRVELVNAGASSVTLRELYRYQPGWGQPGPASLRGDRGPDARHRPPRWQRSGLPDRHRLIHGEVTRTHVRRRAAPAPLFLSAPLSRPRLIEEAADGGPGCLYLLDPIGGGHGPFEVNPVGGGRQGAEPSGEDQPQR